MLLPKKQYDDRLKICASCPNYIKVLGIGRCKICGCIMAVKAKISATKCPIEKWDKKGEM